MKDFKRYITESNLVTNGNVPFVNSSTPHLMLWTALGVARFAKSFLLQKKFKAVIIALTGTITNALLRKRIYILATRRFKVKFWEGFFMMDIVIYEGTGTDEIGQMNRLEVNGELVLTTVQLAQFFSCSTQSIRKTFHVHKAEFIEGVHYFKLEGEDLRNFKRNITESNNVTKGNAVNFNVNSLTLWTALGAARFAKSLRTKKAWAVYEHLVVNYFKTLPDKKSAKNSSKNELTVEKKIKFLLQAAKITKNEAVRENLIATAEKLIIGI